MFNRKKYLKEVISNINERDLKRILNSTKTFILFDVSIFNTGFIVRVHLTNDIKRCDRVIRDGHSFYLQNIDEEVNFIKDVMIEKVAKQLQETEPGCIVDGAAGMYTPKEFCKRYGIAPMLPGPENFYYWDIWDEIIQDINNCLPENLTLAYNDSGDLCLLDNDKNKIDSCFIMIP
jgi:hypothetical protein